MTDENSNNAVFGLAPSLDGNNWMARYDGATSLSQLTLPGTHDSGARYNLNDSPQTTQLYAFAQNFLDSTLAGTLYGTVAPIWDNLVDDTIKVLNNARPILLGLDKLGGIDNNDFDTFVTRIDDLKLPDLGGFVNAPLAEAQTLSVTDQLEAGIRFLDLRGRKVDDTLEVYHGPIGQDLGFDQALGDVSAFLERNPTETVLVYTQREDGLKVEGFDPSKPDWLGDSLGGGLPGWAIKPALNVLGNNLSAFMLDGSVERLEAIRPDYIEDLRANLNGASDGSRFTSDDAQQNFYTLLKDNYGFDVSPISSGDVLTILDSVPSLLTKISPLEKSLESINHFVAEFGLAWLEQQRDSGLSASVVDGDFVLNAANNTDLSYDQLLDKYIEQLGAENFYLADEVPSLADARGKIVLMVREMAGESRDPEIPLGLDLSGKADNSTGTVVRNPAGEVTVITQDFYEPGSSEAKWQAFEDLAMKAVAEKNDVAGLYATDAVYINYLSATNSDAYAEFNIPAIGPAGYSKNLPVTIDGRTYQGLNAAFQDLFLDRQPDGRYGAMLTDFSTPGMARQIYEKNSIVDSVLAIETALKPTVMRVDSQDQGTPSVGAVAFGLKPIEGGAATTILQSDGPGQMPYSLSMIPGEWQAREAKALGDIANAAEDIASGLYLPVAEWVDANGVRTELPILEVRAHSQSHVEVVFDVPGYVNPHAVFKLEGSDPLVLPENAGQDITVEIARLGKLTNGLAFYEADQVTGAITVGDQVYLPGDAGYLEQAFALAETGGNVIRGNQMPDFGESTAINGLNLDAGTVYGLLVLHDDSETDLSSSFSDANRGDQSQIVELPSAEGEIWYGIEDLHLAGVSDRDFNDLLVNIQFA